MAPSMGALAPFTIAEQLGVSVEASPEHDPLLDRMLFSPFKPRPLSDAHAPRPSGPSPSQKEGITTSGGDNDKWRGYNPSTHRQTLHSRTEKRGGLGKDKDKDAPTRQKTTLYTLYSTRPTRSASQSPGIPHPLTKGGDNDKWREYNPSTRRQTLHSR